MSRVLLTICFIGLATACAPNHAASARPDAGSPSQAPQLLAEAICELAQRCTSGQAVVEPVSCTEAAMRLGGQELQPGMLQWVQNGPNTVSFDTLEALQDSIDAGLVTVDMAALGRCTRAIGGLWCSDVPLRFTTVPECAEVFTGRVVENARCITTLACAPGTICASRSPSAAVPCSATCLPIGTVCRDDDDCDSEHSCSGGTCEVARKPAGKEGQPCGSSFNLYTDTRCQAGLVCSRIDSTGTCEAPRTEGQSCENYDGCESGLECLPESDTNSSCRAPRSITEGGTCNPYDPFCAPGLRCVSAGEQSTCIRLRGKGESCSSPNDCGRPQSGLVCDQSSHLCVEEPTSGPCPAPDLLPTGGCDARSTYCRAEDKRCVPFLSPGATCRSGDECGQPGLARYCNPSGNAGFCTTWPEHLRCMP